MHRTGTTPRGPDRIGSCHDLEPLIGEVARDAIPPHRMVVDDHHPQLVAVLCLAHLFSRVTGTVSSHSVPIPSSESSSALPPRDSILPIIDCATPSLP